MWQLVLGALQANKAQADARIAQDEEYKRSERERILKDRESANIIKNKTVSDNYGKYNIEDMMSSVFKNRPTNLGAGVRGTNGL